VTTSRKKSNSKNFTEERANLLHPERVLHKLFPQSLETIRRALRQEDLQIAGVIVRRYRESLGPREEGACNDPLHDSYPAELSPALVKLMDEHIARKKLRGTSSAAGSESQESGVYEPMAPHHPTRVLESMVPQVLEVIRRALRKRRPKLAYELVEGYEQSLRPQDRYVCNVKVHQSFPIELHPFEVALLDMMVVKNEMWGLPLPSRGEKKDPPVRGKATGVKRGKKNSKKGD
jgi:hypothetical protein